MKFTFSRLLVFKSWPSRTTVTYQITKELKWEIPRQEIDVRTVTEGSDTCVS
jgi:hypothetical protein